MQFLSGFCKYKGCRPEYKSAAKQITMLVLVASMVGSAMLNRTGQSARQPLQQFLQHLPPNLQQTVLF